MQTCKAVDRTKDTVSRSYFSGSSFRSPLPSLPLLRRKGSPRATIQQPQCLGGNKANTKLRHFYSLKTDSIPEAVNGLIPSPHLTSHLNLPLIGSR